VFSEQPDTYRDFLKEWKNELLQKNREGKRPIDVGSVTMGYRLGNSKVGFDVNRLIYAKVSSPSRFDSRLLEEATLSGTSQHLAAAPPLLAVACTEDVEV